MTDKTTVNVREIVLDMLLETCEKEVYSHLILSAILEKYQYIDVQKKKFLTRLFEGTVEYRLLDDAVLNRYSKIKVNKMKPVVRNILRMGVYQLLYMDSVPDSAVCNEAVKLAKKRGFQGLSGFVNGVLRNISRDKDNIYFKSLSEKYSIPQWIIDEWSKQFDEDTIITILEGINKKQGVSIRCNTSAINCEEFYSELENQGITVRRSKYIKEAAFISGFDSIENIFGFNKGYFQIQDIDAMVAVNISGVKPDYKILDVCAAPGGKSIQFADMLNGSGIVEARDLSENKVEIIEENISRNNMKNIKAVCMNAEIFDAASKDKYDIVLADLPCSGLGVIGKKADIRYRVKQEDIAGLATLQRDILSVVWQYVKPGGVLIYSTCTINETENQDNVKWFTENFPFETESFSDSVSNINDAQTATKGWLQLLPGIHEGDGAFVAKLRRKA